MSSRNYAQIGCSLLASKKMKRLQSHQSRWAYLCAHLSPLGNYTGMFRYPLTVWADDASLSVVDLKDCIQELTEVGLIEFDEDDSIVRITSWFHKKNCPENGSRMISLIADYYAFEGDNTGMYVRSIAEFVVGSVRRAQSWKKDSPDWSKLRENFRDFLRQTYQDYGDEFLVALTSEVMGGGKAVRAEIGALFPLCEAEIDALEATPSGHPVDTLRPHDTTRHDTNTTLRRDLDEHETANFESASKAVEAIASEDPREVPRKGSTEVKRIAQVMPLSATKASGLAQQALEARSKEKRA